MLSGDQLSVVIDGLVLVDIDALQVEPGLLLGMVGPNGAGKSTALRVLSGEQTPTTGRVVMNGTSLADWPARERALTRAVLPQSSSLNFAFRVSDVVLMGRCPHSGNTSTADDMDIAGQAMQMTDTAHLAERIYTDLSGGEKQRVHLARVLSQLWTDETTEPKYLLLDEPTSALDLAHQHQILSIVRAFAQQHNVGVLVILHDLNLAAMYVDRLVMLRQGRVHAAGTPAEVLDAATVEAVFDYPVTIGEHPGRKGCPMVIVSPMKEHDRG